MKYLIVGASLRSRGGEAMVFEACKVIRELDNAAHIFLLSHDAAYDARLLEKLGNPYKIKICEPNIKRINKYLDVIHDFFAIILAQMFKRMNIKVIRSPYRTLLLRCLNDSDIVIEIAGISFTENLGLLNAVYSTIRMLCARLLEKKYLCLPQSYGPSNSILINLLAKIGLSTVTCIMPRGRMSIEFLRRIGIRDKVIFVPDLAFSYENPSENYKMKVYQRLGISNSKKYIGILPNIHLYRWSGMRIINMLANVIDNLTICSDYYILLIPHEMRGSTTARLDDEFMCNLLYKRVKNKSRIIMIPGELTANEIRSLIALCDFTIVSRYHAMISSLKMCVPPVVIGWANKYYETMELFDLSEFVIDYRHLKEDELINKITILLRKKDDVVNKIKGKLAKYEKASTILKNLLKSEIYEKY
mgnify:CR=1 FL=1